jgi:hypothetical protein
MADLRIEYQVEPRSGQTVDTRSEVTVKVLHPDQGETVTFVSNLRFTEDTVDRNLSTARNARIWLLLLTSYVPWLIMGLGMLFGLYSVFLYGVLYWRGMRTIQASPQ